MRIPPSTVRLASPKVSVTAIRARISAGGAGGAAGAGGTIAVATRVSASASAAASAAVRNWPPVASATHCICSRAAGSLTSKPTTWAVKFTPASSSARAAAQGSGLQVSTPSETRITVAASSV